MNEGLLSVPQQHRANTASTGHFRGVQLRDEA
eukprot:CAMPEP_0182809444 /NCGR_PEP_ID=MMETSP0006_2-20121128/7187_1 /TAXON_ID=97485 /ORGANISM="Prymnesium parvum, Strain Texoma1" /LENGTH=31 /DNA_ID= /DNA_START= /DNA_END= /DNA_ORIENTATION=